MRAAQLHFLNYVRIQIDRQAVIERGAAIGDHHIVVTTLYIQDDLVSTLTTIDLDFIRTH